MIQILDPGYKMKSKQSFSDAFETLRKDEYNELFMRLPNWNPRTRIRIQYPDENSKMTAPYLYVDSAKGKVPWKENMIELFDNNWEVWGLL